MTTINLPFDLGQKVWTLSDENKAIEIVSRDITISICENETCSYTNYYSKPVYENGGICRKESQLFATREDLKNSIFGNID